MKLFSKAAIALGGIATLTLAGCINPSEYETAPVEVKTPKGVVTCQLYTHERVIWDEAISVPAGMSIAEGDRICKDEGLRRLKR